MQPQPRYVHGDKIGGRFLVHQTRLGGMGEVYLCLDLVTNTPFALKTLRARYLEHPKLHKDFKREVATWIALEKHSNIVRCYFLDYVDNLPFIFMEWIPSDENERSSLRDWLRPGPLNLRLALDFTIDICRGLAHAGNKQPGIVHHDLKPDNILVTPNRIAKITDFGLAKIVQAAELDTSDAAYEHTEQSRAGGTPHYMAPEQWRGQETDVRTDIYAVGCMVYEMLTGRWPFEATTVEKLCQMHMSAPIPRLSVHGTLSIPINTLLSRCLAKRKSERFATVNDVLQQFESLYQQLFAASPKAFVSSGDFTAEDYQNRANTYSRLGRYHEALEDFSRSIQLNPTWSASYSDRGTTYYKMERYEEALADHDRAVQLDPTDGRAFINRGNTHADMKLYAEALSDYTLAIQLDPTFPMAYGNRGLAYAEMRRYEEALSDLAHAIQLSPNVASLYLTRAMIYAETNALEAALTDLTLAIEIDPAFAKAHSNRGRLHMVLKRYDEALDDLKNAVAFDSADASVWFDLGAVLAQRGMLDEALSCFAKAAQGGPYGTQVKIRRMAFEAIERTRELLTDTLESWEIRARIMVEEGNFREALQCFERGLILDPNSIGFLENKGVTLMSLSRMEEALECFERVLQLSPKNASTWHNRGVALGQLGQYAEALECFDRAIQYDPALEAAQEGRQRASALLYQRRQFNREVVRDQTSPKGSEMGLLSKLFKRKQKQEDNSLIRPHVARPLACPNCGMELSQEAHQHYKNLGISFIRSKCTQCFATLQLDLNSGEIESVDPRRLALIAFESTESQDDMRDAVGQFPFMTTSEYLRDLQLIAREIPRARKRRFEQRQAWLREIARSSNE
jgi:tetratricopeptide (TPR) repeat protein/tRNA A-37 threonylcarbamoyl transferase component Bud32